MAADVTRNRNRVPGKMALMSTLPALAQRAFRETNTTASRASFRGTPSPHRDSRDAPCRRAGCPARHCMRRAPGRATLPVASVLVSPVPVRSGPRKWPADPLCIYRARRLETPLRSFPSDNPPASSPHRPRSRPHPWPTRSGNASAWLRQV